MEAFWEGAQGNRGTRVHDHLCLTGGAVRDSACKWYAMLLALAAFGKYGISFLSRRKEVNAIWIPNKNEKYLNLIIGI